MKILIRLIIVTGLILLGFGQAFAINKPPTCAKNGKLMKGAALQACRKKNAATALYHAALVEANKLIKAEDAYEACLEAGSGCSPAQIAADRAAVTVLALTLKDEAAKAKTSAAALFESSRAHLTKAQATAEAAKTNYLTDKATTAEKSTAYQDAVTAESNAQSNVSSTESALGKANSKVTSATSAYNKAHEAYEKAYNTAKANNTLSRKSCSAWTGCITIPNSEVMAAQESAKSAKATMNSAISAASKAKEAYSKAQSQLVIDKGNVSSAYSALHAAKVAESDAHIRDTAAHHRLRASQAAFSSAQQLVGENRASAIKAHKRYLRYAIIARKLNNALKNRDRAYRTSGAQSAASLANSQDNRKRMPYSRRRKKPVINKKKIHRRLPGPGQTKKSMEDQAATSARNIAFHEKAALEREKEIARWKAVAHKKNAALHRKIEMLSRKTAMLQREKEAERLRAAHRRINAAIDHYQAAIKKHENVIKKYSDTQ